MATQQAKPIGKPDYAPPPIDGDFYRIAAVLNDRERALLKRVREFTEGVVAPVIEDYWSRRCISLRDHPEDGRSRYRRGGLSGIWRCRRQLAPERPCRDGVGTCRCVGRDVLGRAHGSFGRIDLSVRGRGAEAALAAGHDAFRADRLVRPDGATGRVGDIGWNDDDLPSRGRQPGSSTARRNGSATPPSPTST